MVSKIALASAALVVMAIALVNCEEEKRVQQAARVKVEAVKAWGAKLRAAEQCVTVDAAMPVIFERQRFDLIERKNGRDPCSRFRLEGCDYKVEILYELSKAGRNDLEARVAKIGVDCADELEFALKHGLGAFRDHRELLEAATEDAAVREEVSRDSRSSPVTEQDSSSPFYDPAKGKH